MPPKKELCRNFQRGSCRYGDRCNFIHASQQQSKPNSFGFGSQSGTQFQRSNQPQQNNPFGFGQSASQPRGATDFGSKNNQFKPFENKWSRDSSSSQAARQPENQSAAPIHKCTDPVECKRLIAEDYQKERPLWNLTCYGHSKNGPCDIVGDVSYEELRFTAYNDAMQGLSLPLIVEKERNLLNAKLLEFESLLRNPYSIPPNSTLASQNPFPGVAPITSPPMTQITAPPAVSSFSQLNTSLNTAFGMRPAAPNNGFGQGFSSQTPAQPFGSQTPAQPFGSQTSPQPFGSQTSPQPFGGQTPAQPFGGQAPTQQFGTQTPAQPFGAQTPAQPFGSSMGPNTSNFGNAGSFGTSPFGNNSVNAGRNPFSATEISPSLNTSKAQSAMLFSGPNATPNGFPQAGNLHSTGNSPRVNRGDIDSIWLKEEWNPGEIPEEAPPVEAIW